MTAQHTLPGIVGKSLDGRYTWHRNGWHRLGRGGTQWVWEEMGRLEAAGYRRVGPGRVPPTASEVRLGPTGAHRPGGPGTRCAWWIGRWYR